MKVWIDSAKPDGSDRKSSEGLVEVDTVNDFHKLIEDPGRDYAFQYHNTANSMSLIFYDCTPKQFYYAGFPEGSPIPQQEIEAFHGILPYPTIKKSPQVV